MLLMQTFANLLTLEKNDPLLYGHLVLYHVIDKNEIEKNIQLWNSDYTKNGSQAMIDVSTYTNSNLINKPFVPLK